MNDYTYQKLLPWILVETSTNSSNATATIYKVGHTVNLSVISETFTTATQVKGKQTLLIPNVPIFFQPEGTINFAITHRYTRPSVDYRDYTDSASLTISGVDLILTADIGTINIGDDLIQPINQSWVRTVVGPTGDISSYGPTGAISLGPITPTVFCTYYMAARTVTTNITVATTLPGTLAAFPTAGSNYALYGTWTISGDSTAITVPVTGVYHCQYTIMVNNNATQTRTISSCIYVNSSIYPSSGATLKLSRTQIGILVGQASVLLISGDQVSVAVLASGAAVSITGTSSLFTGDNTSASISLIKISN